ncbi:MAG: fructosamine kinase family protein [Eubacteriales bacterium]|nr:fructosamine kinase family protein [Eubacteriales bacterium]
MITLRIEDTYKSIEEAARSAYGENVEITSFSQLCGGGINETGKIGLSNGEKLFLKKNTINNYKFFKTEAVGLKTLCKTGQIGVPQLFGTGIDKERGFSFLLLEYIENTRPRKNYWEYFGHQLAGMHKAQTADILPEEAGKGMFGFVEDNFIGAFPQKNTPRESWTEFYRECRLIPQIKAAAHYFDVGIRRKLGKILDDLPKYLREPPFPSLLHGDLWAGNVMCGKGGRAWILDPAVYIGDFETDLAMTELFGGFPMAFYRAYHEENPIDEGYEQRKKYYHLYHLLNHLNLFGKGYLRNVVETVNDCASM